MSENTQNEKETAVQEEKKIAELEEKVAKDKDDYIRLMAEFDNYRRRTSTGHFYHDFLGGAIFK